MADQGNTPEDRGSPRIHQLTLRTLMLLLLVLALVLSWWVDHVRLARQIPAQPQREVRVFTLVRGNAQELAAAIGELFPSDSPDPLHVATDRRTNSIIARGTPEDLTVVEAILLKIEADESSPIQRLGRQEDHPLADQQDEDNTWFTVADYDPGANPSDDLIATVSQASDSGKRIILEIGGQW